jgi:hypothetical protein
MSSENKFIRSSKAVFSRRVFIIAAEGMKTEPEYFNKVIRRECQQCQISFSTFGKRRSAPYYVLDRMKRYLDEYDIKDNYEAWLVVDKDHWADEQIAELYNWAKKNENYNVALSNPMFEYWLLLHFEDGNDITSQNCRERLKRYIPDYDKGINPKKFTKERIMDAIRRAKNRNSGEDWPRNLGGTTVYKLVDNIFKTNDQSQSP